jgi:hypothetical protein
MALISPRHRCRGSELRRTPQSLILMFNAENWYFVK